MRRITQAILSVFLLSGLAFSCVGAEAPPALHFDSQGRLILVVTPDGKRCIFQYGSDGKIIPQEDQSCGSPNDWLKPTTGKNQ